MKEEIFILFAENIELRKAVARVFGTTYDIIRVQALRKSVRLSDYRVIKILRKFHPELTDEDIFKKEFIELMSN